MVLRRRGLHGALAAVLMACAAAVTACSGSGPGEKVAVNATPDIEPGTTMEELHKAGRITIGVPFDQPGLGYKGPEDDEPEGFDIEMAKIIAGQLGLGPDRIDWVETAPEDRERFLEDGTVDLILSAYSITDERREVVGQAGPYYTTGQQLLVRTGEKGIDGPKDVEGQKVCALNGTTSIKRVEREYGAIPAPRSSHDECIRDLLAKTVDAVTADGAALLGYVAQDPENLKVVGEPFSTERFGVGYPRGDTAMCEFLTDTLSRAFWDGTWDKALLDTIWKAFKSLPDYPALDPCV